MKAGDTVTFDCVCDGYDFVPTMSSYDDTMIHCSECNAYNMGKRAQEAVSFEAGRREGRREVWKAK